MGLIHVWSPWICIRQLLNTYKLYVWEAFFSSLVITCKYIVYSITEIIFKGACSEVLNFFSKLLRFWYHKNCHFSDHPSEISLSNSFPFGRNLEKLADFISLMVTVSKQPCWVGCSVHSVIVRKQRRITKVCFCLWTNKDLNIVLHTEVLLKIN